MASQNESDKQKDRENQGGSRKRKFGSTSPTPQDGDENKDGQPPNKKGGRRPKGHPEPDYSAMVKRSMAAATRTAQACDRCKGRKMKCDSNPECCANCSASDSQCTQTDPVTKRTVPRGEWARMENDKNALIAENTRLREEIGRQSELIRQLAGMGGMGGMGGGGLPTQKGLATFGHPQQQPFRIPQTGPGSTQFSFRSGHPHPNPFQQNQAHYNQPTPGYTDMYLNNAGLTLPPLMPHQQQHHHANPPGYTPTTTTLDTTAYDIPGMTAPATATPTQAAAAIPASSSPYVQHHDPQAETDLGTGEGDVDGDRNGIEDGDVGGGEFEGYQKDWPY